MEKLNTEQLQALTEDILQTINEGGDGGPGGNPGGPPGGGNAPAYDLEWISRTLADWGGQYTLGYKDVIYLIQGLKKWGQMIPPGGE